MSNVALEWKSWVVKCLLSGQNTVSIAQTLYENGFVPSVIRTLLGSNLPPNIAFSHESEFYRALANAAIINNPNAEKLVSDDRIQLYAIDGFLTKEECEGVIQLSKDKLAPSKLAGAASSDNIRTSSTCELAFLNNPLVEAINTKIVNALQLGVGEKEVIQAQHYNVGEYYKPHYDFFPPGTPQYKAHCAARGQRSWTCTIYLNEDCDGGHTRFTKLKLAIKPKIGKALFWNNLLYDGQPNLNSIHFAEPVTDGNKTVITKWFRTKN